MLSLRQKATKSDCSSSGNGVDEESQSKSLQSPPSSSSSPFKSSSSSSSSSASAHRIILRKICQATLLRIINNDNDGDDDNGRITTNNHQHTVFERIVSAVRDILLGLFFGILSISLILFLDHHNIIHVESAKVLRNSALESLNTVENIGYLEESSGLKFMTLEEYNFRRGEIQIAQDIISKSQKELELRNQDLNLKNTELKPYLEKYETLLKHPEVELDKYCGECRLSPGTRTSCDERVAYFMSTYGDSPLKAKTGLMRLNPSCKKE